MYEVSTSHTDSYTVTSCKHGKSAIFMTNGFSTYFQRIVLMKQLELRLGAVYAKATPN